MITVFKGNECCVQGKLDVNTEKIPKVLVFNSYKKKKKESVRFMYGEGQPEIVDVVFLSCPLVKKHADLLGSFLYSQSTMKNIYSKPTNRTKLSIPMKTKSIA